MQRKMRGRTVLLALALGGLLAMACAQPAPPTSTPSPEPRRATPTTAPQRATPTATESGRLSGPVAERRIGSDERPLFPTTFWQTNFLKRTVRLDAIASGGVGRDGIPPIYDPQFLTITQAEKAMEWLQARQPVAVAEVAGEAKAYPLTILSYHEAVNDVLGGTPVLITYCPLCNSALGFDRRVKGQALEFGVSGNLYNSNLILWDRTTQSWWQQLTGEAIVGEAAGLKLAFFPVQTVSWADYKKAYPEGLVLSSDTGYPEYLAYYGQAQYERYDAPNKAPFLFSGALDPRLPALERVVALEVGGRALAFPYTLLSQREAINYGEGETSLVLFWKAGTASPLDTVEIVKAKDVGATGVFRPVVEGRRLTFRPGGDGTFLDDQTGSAWSLLGQAVGGALAGKRLEPVVHHDSFWFSWAAFRPGVEVYSPP